MKRQVDYWSRTATSKKDALEGLVLGIMELLDKGNPHIPNFLVMPAPTDTDKLLLMERGMDWFPEDCDIGGSLKESYSKLKR